MDNFEQLREKFTNRKVDCGAGRYLLTFEMGQGQTAVFIHGAASSWWSFRYQYQKLSSHYRIVAPNLRGHGGTPWYETESIEEFYQDICLWFKNMNFSSPVLLVGHSLGGYLSARYASDYPEQVARLVLMSTCGNFEKGAVRFFLENCWAGADAVHRLFPWLVAINSHLAGCLARVVFSQWNCWDAYPKIVAPTLLVLGTFDPLFSLKQGKRMQKLIPNARLKIVACGGHNPQIDHGSEVASLIQKFFVEKNFILDYRSSV
ncbi:MAG: alpha/beta fold hydrolase [Candidatus Bruticola sp.]